MLLDIEKSISYNSEIITDYGEITNIGIWHYERGVISCIPSNVDGNPWYCIEITFKQPFICIPCVTINPHSYFSSENIVVQSVSRGGMTFFIRTMTNGFDYRVIWNAFGI